MISSIGKCRILCQEYFAQTYNMLRTFMKMMGNIFVTSVEMLRGTLPIFLFLSFVGKLSTPQG